ncbi:response regulator [Sphingomonas sp.]|uniref:response regulator n=1 Tax=Sphingomonas sp. TaxID=28214 RepID=UPI0017C0205F|nr:response regulator [Sphingomonas sp.]MBA3511325.1 response regulator [Sphingomonas sp.]
MLHQELPAIDASSLDGVSRWLVPALVGAAALTGALLAWLLGYPLVAAGIAVAGLAGAIAVRLADRRSEPAIPQSATLSLAPDYSVIGSTLGLSREPAALTDCDGGLLVANSAYRDRFGGAGSPLKLGTDADSSQSLQLVWTMAVRDGGGCVTGVSTASGATAVEVERVGSSGELLLWRFPKASAPNPMTVAAKQVAGPIGERLAAAGMLAALVDADGRLVAANRSFASRAVTNDEDADKLPFADLVEFTEDGKARLVAEGESARPLQVVHIPVDPRQEGGAGTFLLVERHEGGALDSADLQALLEILPIGLALVDRDGRFLTMNRAFRVAAGIKGTTMPSYPGDLVVKEDKAPVANAVRRNARGPAMSGDVAVRLAKHNSEPVALTVAGVRGLGDAAVLLLLKDNSEEAKLKRQIAQATKMQVVGQLAGGVAHDFNNILTAIIGHCDLMLMRHTPGDSDYDDIQQIKSNSNRAAGLTRQLLAFSRQQTLRPQVLQLPDVVSEVSHLLKRLLGETVKLVVKHGRDLGPVRADPGQLEQVIVNLAVNARDAMVSQGGGTLTIQTYAVRADQVAELGSEILPVADYSALSVTDTGCGIPAGVLGKVFEPFFTTKEVGKGTGLGLSTVYGIVKQSGGFIFADSKVGEGTRFVIYLPVHREDATAGKARRVAKPKEHDLWGTGTILLVEDEPMVRGVAERALTRHGYTVITAENGEEALEVLATGEEIALLISDVVMPAMDGPTMVREARKTRPDLKILFMSGYAEEQLRNSIDIDNVAFLPKPFSVQELAEATRRALSVK